jgi:hypothetical protein
LQTLERVNQPAGRFCNLPSERIPLETGMSLAFRGSHPVAESHAFVIAKMPLV